MLKYADEQMDFGLWDGVRSWHFSIFTISRLWEKHDQQCKMMNVDLILLRHYLN